MNKSITTERENHHFHIGTQPLRGKTLEPTFIGVAAS